MPRCDGGRRRSMPPVSCSVRRCAGRLECGVEVSLGGWCRPDGKSCPMVGIGPWVARHRNRGVLADQLTEERLQRTPTWRAKCRILGSGKPLRFEHWGAHEDLSLPSSLSQRSQGLARRSQGTRDTRVYTGSGHRCGVIPYSSVVWWIAL